MIFTNVIIPILLFGVLVFIHELGHFTVAKLCGVFVERFAIGFGPALFKKKMGETEYALCLFPLGGYVKMRGEELPETEEEKSKPIDPRSFAAQNVWKRIAIVIMGPTSNFVLPIVLFTILFMVGLPTPSSQIGSVLPNSPAEKAGLIAGDHIVQVNHENITTWENMTKAIQGRGNMQTDFLIKRGEKLFTATFTPTLGDDRNEYGEAIQAGKIGVDFIAYKPVIGISNLESDAYKQGLRTGDLVTKVNDKEIQYWWQLESEFSKNTDKVITIQRPVTNPPATLTYTFPATSMKLESTGIENGELFINKVADKSIAAEKGLKVGDKIDTVNGTKLSKWSEFRETIQKNQGEQVILGLIREGKPLSLDITPQEVVQKNEMTNEKKKIRQLGVISESQPYLVDLYVVKYTNFFRAVKEGFAETWTLTKQTFVGLGKLATGKLGMNSLGGPISIFSMASTSYESGGWSSFFRLMAILSITLAALNILPIPVLDGGHLFFYVIEAIKGSPVKLRVRQVATQVGFYMLMGLMVLVFYVDINRYFVDRIKALFN